MKNTIWLLVGIGVFRVASEPGIKPGPLLIQKTVYPTGKIPSNVYHWKWFITQQRNRASRKLQMT